MDSRKVKAKVGDIVDFKLPLSFTKEVVPVLTGRAPGSLFSGGFETFLMVNNPSRGLEIDYSKLKLNHSAQSEQEVLIAGKYRVVKITKAIKPGQAPRMKYDESKYETEYNSWVPLIILEEAG